MHLVIQQLYQSFNHQLNKNKRSSTTSDVPSVLSMEDYN